MEKVFYVKCKTEERLDNVLMKAEELGYKWIDGEKPTEWKPENLNEVVIYFIENKKWIAKGSFKELKERGGKERKVKYKDFIHPQEERFELGKKYIFDLEKFKKCTCLSDEAWAKDCDGKEITFYAADKGNVGVYKVIPEWCREVEVKEIDFAIGDFVRVIDTGKMYSTAVAMVEKIAKGNEDLLSRFAYHYSPFVTGKDRTLPGKYIVRGISGSYILIQSAIDKRVLLIDKAGLRPW